MGIGINRIFLTNQLVLFIFHIQNYSPCFVDFIVILCYTIRDDFYGGGAMKANEYLILTDYALLLAQKYYKEDLPQNFVIGKHSISEYKNALKSFDLQSSGICNLNLFSGEMTLKEKQLVLLLFGSSLNQNNHIFLWKAATVLHKFPAKAMKFISHILHNDSTLLKNGIIVVDNIDFTENSFSLHEITNSYRNIKIFLSPHSLIKLFSGMTGNTRLGFPVLDLKYDYKTADKIIADIVTVMKYIFFITHYYRASYSPHITAKESIYQEGEVAVAIAKIKEHIRNSTLNIELKNVLNENSLTNVQFVSVIYLIYKVVVLKQLAIGGIDEVIGRLTFNLFQTSEFIECFSNNSFLTKEKYIDSYDEFSGDEEYEWYDFNGRHDFDSFDFDYGFSAIKINRDKIYGLIFTDNRVNTEKLKNKAETSENRSTKNNDKSSGLYEIVIPTVTTKNVILDEEVKRDLLGAVDMTKTIETMKEWEVRPTLSSKSFSSIKILLYGPSGTGKTLTAEALAGEAKAELFKVDAANLVTSWVGESSKNVRRVFKEFYEYAEKSDKKVFMFFNEADQLLSTRGAIMQAADKEYNQMQNLLLEEIENFDGVFIATTNLIDLFDSAWNRRFNIKIKFDIPSFKTRLKLWKLHISSKMPIASEVNLKKLAEYELAGGSIANIVYNAARKAALRSGEKRIVTQKDFLTAVKNELSSRVGGNHNKVGFS